MLQNGRMFLNDLTMLFSMLAEVVSKNGSMIKTSILGTVWTGTFFHHVNVVKLI